MMRYECLVTKNCQEISQQDYISIIRIDTRLLMIIEGNRANLFQHF